MRKIALLICFCGSMTLHGITQTFSVEPNTTLYINNVPLNELSTTYIFQLNTSSQDINMAWERVFVDVPASWENYLCDLGACYPNIPDGAAMNGSVSTGSSSFVGLNLVPDIDGAGMVQVNVWDVAIPDHKVLCTFYFSTGTVALMELKTAEVMMYPNPANDQLNMRIDATHTSSAMYMTMINITGSVVKEIYLGPLTYVTIDISDLPVGFYTAILTDGLSILSKKKLVIQH